MSGVDINFDNSFQERPAFLHENVEPTPLKEPTLIHVTALKTTLGLNHLVIPVCRNG